MKATIQKILSDIEREVDELQKEKSDIIKNGEKIFSTKKIVITIDKTQLLKNAHIMVCNAFNEQSKFDI
jgi:hypothetical protein